MQDMNSGYNGWSMSKRAAAAYANEEMPKSKWTKKAMVAALTEWAYDNDRTMDDAALKLKKDDMFSELFAWSSWHHTSKMINATDFYSIDESAAMEHSHPTTDAERAAIEAEMDADRAAHEKMLAEIAAAKEERERPYIEFSAALPSFDAIVRAMVAKFPERCAFHTSRKHNPMVGLTKDSGDIIQLTFVRGHWTVGTSDDMFLFIQPSDFQTLID